MATSTISKMVPRNGDGVGDGDGMVGDDDGGSGWVDLPNPHNETGVGSSHQQSVLLCHWKT